MSFFAVARGEDEQDFIIVMCHLNYWALQGLWSDRFLLDVGLLLKPLGTKSLTSFQLALPFGTVDGALSNLREVLVEPKTLALVFGEQIPVQDNIIDLPKGHGKGRLLAAVIGESPRAAPWSTNDFSLWTIKLDRDLTVGEQGYLRIRFRVFHSGRTWTWRKSLRAKNGALFDLRVADTREAWSVRDRETLIPRIREIQQLFAFIVVPSWLQPAVVHPQPHYLRLLEGRAWEAYLGRSIGFWKSRKLVIYQWRKENVSTRSKFQGFLDLRRAEPLHHTWNHVRTAVVVAALLLSLLWLSDNTSTASIRWVRAQASTWVTGLVAAGVFGALTKLTKGWKIVQKLRGGLQRLEDWILKVRFR